MQAAALLERACGAVEWRGRWGRGDMPLLSRRATADTQPLLPSRCLCSNGVIDRDELRALLQRVGGGDEAVPLVSPPPLLVPCCFDQG